MTPGLRFLPFVCLLLLTASAQAQLNSQEQQIVSYMTNASGQNRPFLTVDPTLSRVARARAADMAKRHYFAHVNPDGRAANYLVRQAGYPLPSSYDQSASGNNIESIEAGDPTAAGAWSAWMASAPHKKHLLAQDPFYAAQTSVGVGFYADSSSDYGYYWVVITAPPPGPSLSIASPAANAGLTTSQASILGNTGGAPAAARVVYRLENSAGTGTFADASGVASWSGSVSGLVPGSNTLRVRSLDSGGATLLEIARTFRYVVLKPLDVAVDGSGTVTTGFLGTTQREIGARYTIAARPATGYLFDHWSGSVESTSASVSFVMAEGFTLTAHFRVNPFAALRGSYNGLVQSASPSNDTSGFLKLALGSTGAFSGRFTLGGKGYAVTGKFDASGAAQLVLKRATLPPLTLTLQLDLNGGTDQISGSVTDGTFTASLSADQALAATEKHFAAGRYTVALPANPHDTGAETPQGSGSAVIAIGTSGLARFNGTLADGRLFTGSATVSKDGLLPVYVPLLTGTGSLAGNVHFTAESSAIEGSIAWSKPARPADHYFPAAFATTLSAAGSRYTAPKAGVPAIEVPATTDNSALQLTGGDLQTQVDQSTTLLPTNLVAILHPQLANLTLRISAASGRVTGSFVHPVTGAISRINGVILQDRNSATGFFLGQTKSGAATFAPAQ